MKAVAQRIGYVLVLVLHRHYPPRVFVFYPLYKVLRRRLRIPMALSVLAVWLISAVLHGIPTAVICGPPVGLAFFGIFASLGLLSAAVVLTTKGGRARHKGKRR